jgi:hypothetical protein
MELSCNFSLKPIHWFVVHKHASIPDIWTDQTHSYTHALQNFVSAARQGQAKVSRKSADYVQKLTLPKYGVDIFWLSKWDWDG